MSREDAGSSLLSIKVEAQVIDYPTKAAKTQLGSPCFRHETICRGRFHANLAGPHNSQACEENPRHDELASLKYAAHFNHDAVTRSLEPFTCVYYRVFPTGLGHRNALASAYHCQHTPAHARATSVYARHSRKLVLLSFSDAQLWKPHSIQRRLHSIDRDVRKKGALFAILTMMSTLRSFRCHPLLCAQCILALGTYRLWTLTRSAGRRLLCWHLGRSQYSPSKLAYSVAACGVVLRSSCPGGGTGLGRRRIRGCSNLEREMFSHCRIELLPLICPATRRGRSCHSSHSLREPSFVKNGALRYCISDPWSVCKTSCGGARLVRLHLHGKYLEVRLSFMPRSKLDHVLKRWDDAKYRRRLFWRCENAWWSLDRRSLFLDTRLGRQAFVLLTRCSGTTDR